MWRQLPSSKILVTRTLFNPSRFFSATGFLPTEESVAPPKHARVVICGGGVMGASVAYHLGKLGWGQDTVLLEQDR